MLLKGYSLPYPQLITWIRCSVNQLEDECGDREHKANWHLLASDLPNKLDSGNQQ